MHQGYEHTLRPWETAMLLALCAALGMGLWADGRQRQLAGRLIRLHVVANSDSPADQAVKLSVRDGVLSLAGPALEGAATAEEAEERLRALLPALAGEAGRISGGKARADLGEEYYPPREYEGFALPAGRYRSLRVTLGEGAGHNWWCVVYPALCTDGPETVDADTLPPGDVQLITGDDAGVVIRFRVIEWWESMKARLTGEG